LPEHIAASNRKAFPLSFENLQFLSKKRK